MVFQQRTDLLLRCGVVASLLLIVLASNACGQPAEPLARMAVSASSPGATPTPTPQFHEVQPGESLWTIAQRYGIDVNTLAEVNELENPDLVQPGQELLISDRITVSGRLLPTATPTPIPCIEGCRNPPPGCDIKGVIARLDGIRFYLIPSDDPYDVRAADVWFCREEDAREAGWQHWTPFGPTSP